MNKIPSVEVKDLTSEKGGKIYLCLNEELRSHIKYYRKSYKDLD